MINLNSLTDKDVPLEFRETHIRHGYRSCNQHFSFYVTSILQLNNETLNFWSHFIPFILTSAHIAYEYIISSKTLLELNTQYGHVSGVA